MHTQTCVCILNMKLYLNIVKSCLSFYSYNHLGSRSLIWLGKLHSVTSKCEKNALCTADRRCSYNSFLQLRFFQCKICKKWGCHYLVEIDNLQNKLPYPCKWNTYANMDRQLGASCCELTLSPSHVSAEDM